MRKTTADGTPDPTPETVVENLVGSPEPAVAAVGTPPEPESAAVSAPGAAAPELVPGPQEVAPEVAPAAVEVASAAPATARLVYTGSQGRVTCRDIEFAAGEPVEVTAETAAVILTNPAFSRAEG